MLTKFPRWLQLVPCKFGRHKWRHFETRYDPSWFNGWENAKDGIRHCDYCGKTEITWSNWRGLETND